MEQSPAQILERFQLRVAITDFCNIGCVFCSNEGMACDQRDTGNVSVEDFAYLLGVLGKNGLKHISLTGGDPTLHPELGRILGAVNNTPSLEQKFFHTNGIELDRALAIGGLDAFTKIAVSVHAFDYAAWKKITHGSQQQYERLMNNLTHLGKAGYGRRVEIKHVPIEGINTSDEMFRRTLDFCSQYRFRFKFLNLEAIEKGQVRLAQPIEDLTQKLERLGCEQVPDQRSFRGQSSYLPITPLSYKGNRGVVIEIGCGEKDVCDACYDSNEIFVMPPLDLKPCHVSNYTIPLVEAVNDRDEGAILDKVVESRRFLQTRPGLDAKYWRLRVVQ
ncbi:MAG: radical SAM protein [Candidatus Nanoarchaeia archaeon]